MKNTIITALLMALPMLANASEAPKVKLSGTLNTQIGHIDQKDAFDLSEPKTPSSHKLNTFSIVNDTKLQVDVEGNGDGFKYGGIVKLNVDTSKSMTGNDQNGDRNLIFIELPLGRFEGGSYNGATDTMKVSAVELGKATGGIDGHHKYWINPSTFDGASYENVFVSDPALPIGCDCTTRANKITYYSPAINGFKVGVSYIPDLRAVGTIANAGTVLKDRGGFRNAFEAALQYEQQFNTVFFKGGLLYQTGEAKDYQEKITKNIRTRKDMNAWEIGALVKFCDLSFAGSFGDWGKSGAPEIGTVRRAYFWDIGAAYEHDKFGISLTYYQSKRGSTVSFDVKDNLSTEYPADAYNKLDVLSLGAEYKLAPGLLPYAEVTHFNHNRAGYSPDNKGVVYLTGMKLTF